MTPAAIGLHLPVDGAILAGGGLLLLGVLGTASAGRLRMPAVLVVLAIGMAIGDDGLDLVSFSDAGRAQSIAVVALVAILFEGGLASSADRLRSVAVPAGLLASVGVAITAGCVAVAAHALFDIDWPTSILAGAIIASTDAAAVFSVLRGAPVGGRVKALLEAESGLNDPVAVLLIVGVLEAVAGDVGPEDWLVFAGRQLLGGAVIGIAVGAAGAWLLRRLVLPSSSLAPVVGLATAAVAYGTATAIYASGFLATYLAGVVVSTMAPRWRRPLRRFNETMATAAEIALFLLLGLLVFPSRLEDVVWPALAITALLVFVARPLSVLLVLLPFRFGRGEIAVVSWAGLRGAVPMVLATFPLTSGHPDGELLFDVAFVVVLVATAVQGSTVGWVARRMTPEDDDEGEVGLVEVVPVDVAGVEAVETVIGPDAVVAGRALADVPLGTGMRIAVIERSGELLVPSGPTRVEPGDRLVVMAVGRTDLAAAVEAWATGAATPE